MRLEWGQMLMGCADWFRIKQEDSPHDALRPQGFPRPQHPRCRPPPYAQQDLRRRVRLHIFEIKAQPEENWTDVI
jgi:hypothetical protein